MQRVESTPLWKAPAATIPLPETVPVTGRGLQFSPVLLFIYMAVMMAYGYLRLTHQTQLTALMTILTVVLMFSTSFVHMVETHGVRRAILLTASAFAMTLLAELVGVATGALFGDYSYSELLGYKVLGLVPLLIPFAWLMMLYPAFETAVILVPRSPAGSERAVCALTKNALLALVAAVAMTVWDLSLDPRMVSDGNWTWRNVGAQAYFGIPASNFAGWLVTAFAIYLVWLWITRAQAQPRPMLVRMDVMMDKLASSLGAVRMTRQLARPLRSQIWSSLPVYIYIITWLGESVVNVVLWHSPLVGLAVFLGMGVFSLPALIALWRSHGEAVLTIGHTLRLVLKRETR